MQFPVSFLRRLIENVEHRALTDRYSKVAESRLLIEAMFPGTNYSSTSLGTVLEEKVIPELKRRFAHLINEAKQEASIEITPVTLRSDN